MKLISKRLLATTFALAMTASVFSTSASAYPASGNWSLYYYPSGERVTENFTLVYSGNGYSARATRIDGNCAYINTTVHVGDDSTELTREGVIRTLKPSNNNKDYVDVHVVLDMGGGTSAISEGTVTRN